MFIGLGASASTCGQAIANHFDILSKIAGGVIIILGLHFMSVFRLSMLFRDTRFHMESKPSGLAGAYVIGLAFAFGWTPCVGPILATILFIAGSEDCIVVYAQNGEMLRPEQGYPLRLFVPGWEGDMSIK